MDQDRKLKYSSYFLVFALQLMLFLPNGNLLGEDKPRKLPERIFGLSKELWSEMDKKIRQIEHQPTQLACREVYELAHDDASVGLWVIYSSHQLEEIEWLHVGFVGQASCKIVRWGKDLGLPNEIVILTYDLDAELQNVKIERDCASGKIVYFIRVRVYAYPHRARLTRTGKTADMPILPRRPDWKNVDRLPALLRITLVAEQEFRIKKDILERGKLRFL